MGGMAPERTAETNQPAHEVSGFITGVVVGYVREVCGEEGVRRLLDQAGECRSVDLLEDPTEWGSYQAARRLIEAADVVTGDPGAARKIGAHVLDRYAGTAVADILLSLGSTDEVLRTVATTAAKQSSIRTMDVVRLERGRAVVAAFTRPDCADDRHFCEYTSGLLSQASVLFGHAAAEVEEPECQMRGAARCLYVVRWSSEPDASGERQTRNLEAQLAGLTSRFEALQATATAFISAANVDEVLATITRRAGLAVRAPRFLLAVHVPSEARLRVHHKGFGCDETARTVARSILSGAMTGQPTHLVVEVVSSRSRFGVLAAIHPDGAAFFPQERPLLEAYAAHAAAALEVASSLDEARREKETAQALLAFGRSLARVATVAEIVQRLTDALPAVVDCDSGAVLLWDDARKVLCLRSTFGLPREVAARFVNMEIRPTDTPAIDRLVRDRDSLLFIDPSTEDPFLAGLIEMAQMKSAAIIPIVVQGAVAGVVAVGRRDTEVRSHPAVLERLAGMADLAATAFANAHLLERVQIEALEDPLTGLPNARLLARAAESALARRSLTSEDSVALLFLDLDGFKAVNDELGHEAGDEVLRSCAQRIRNAVRDSDTVARLGGDEFVVLMPNAGRAAADALADRLRVLFSEPIAVGSREVRIEGSVGIALASADDDVRSLLKRADDAMYVAKARRRREMAADRDAGG